VTFDHQLDRFTVQPKIDDLDLEQPNRPAENESKDRCDGSHAAHR